MGKGKTLEQEFATLEAETGLDAELSALKDKLGGKAGGA
jgi:phage shock protein A